MKANRHKLNNPSVYDPVYSFDNPSIHDMTLLEPFGIDTSNRFPLPTYAADMHKVIEHVHGRLVGQMRNKVLGCTSKPSKQWYRTTLKQLFSQISADSIDKDVLSLIDTFTIIAKAKAEGGMEGNWAPRPYH